MELGTTTGGGLPNGEEDHNLRGHVGPSGFLEAVRGPHGCKPSPIGSSDFPWWQPIAFQGRKLNPAQTRHTTTEREPLSVGCLVDQILVVGEDFDLLP